jgi:hypothetical protein
MTQDADVREQVLSYARHQAAKSPADLAELMERTSADCARCLEGMTDRQAEFKYDREWSVKEVLGHLIGAMALVNADIAGVAQGKEPRPAYGEGPTSGYERGLEDLRGALAREWSRTIRLVRSLSDDVAGKAMPPHPMFGPLNLKEWIAFLRLHAMDHIQQMETIKAHTDYPED